MNMSWPELFIQSDLFPNIEYSFSRMPEVGADSGNGRMVLKMALLPAKHLIRSELRHIESRPFLFRYCNSIAETRLTETFGNVGRRYMWKRVAPTVSRFVLWPTKKRHAA